MTIDAAQAIAIARARAEELGWGFGEPVDCFESRTWGGAPKAFAIETNAGSLGTKARFTIDAVTGEILEEVYIPR